MEGRQILIVKREKQNYMYWLLTKTKHENVHLVDMGPYGKVVLADHRIVNSVM